MNRSQDQDTLSASKLHYVHTGIVQQNSRALAKAAQLSKPLKSRLLHAGARRGPEPGSPSPLYITGTRTVGEVALLRDQRGPLPVNERQLITAGAGSMAFKSGDCVSNTSPDASAMQCRRCRLP